MNFILFVPLIKKAADSHPAADFIGIIKNCIRRVPSRLSVVAVPAFLTPLNKKSSRLSPTASWF
jgi:hypothetical protein